jgi:hypothetical protein
MNKNNSNQTAVSDVSLNTQKFNNLYKEFNMNKSTENTNVISDVSVNTSEIEVGDIILFRNNEVDNSDLFCGYKVLDIKENGYMTATQLFIFSKDELNKCNNYQILKLK